MYSSKYWYNSFLVSEVGGGSGGGEIDNIVFGVIVFVSCSGTVPDDNRCIGG